MQILVTLALVALLLYVVDLGSLARVLTGIHPSLFLAGLLPVFADRLLMAGKWFPLLRCQAPSIGFGRALRAYLAAGFAAYILPATVGADLLRAIALGRGRRLVVEVGSSIAVERLLGMLASAVFTFVALLLALRAEIPLDFVLPWALTALLVSAGFSMLPFSRRVMGWSLAVARRLGVARLESLVGRLVKALEAYRSERRILLVFTLLSLVEQFLPVAGLWIFAQAIEVPVSLEMLIITGALVNFVMRLPVSFNGIGAAEAGYVFLLGLFGIPAEQALALALLARVGEILGVLPGALFWSDLAGFREAASTDPARADAGTGR
jgi:uncharacterized protein (TIRG00374 family)